MPMTEPCKMSATEARSAGKAGKLPVGLGVFAYFPLALREVARVSDFGANKHKVDIRERGFANHEASYYEDAMARHALNRYVSGEVNREDGDVYELAQIAWNAMAALQLKLERGELSDFGGGIALDRAIKGMPE